MGTDQTPERLRSLCKSLWRELFQTEMSAVQHCRREAERHAGATPGLAMLDVARHASMVLEQLPVLAVQHELPVSTGGLAMGAIFSELRQRVGDHFVDAERSYRGTLLGMRHGADVVRMLRHVAQEAGAPGLVTFCDTWLSVRLPLIGQAEDQLSWFAGHAERATELARPLPFLGRLRHA
jgi:hypothetical protein